MKKTSLFFVLLFFFCALCLPVSAGHECGVFPSGDRGTGRAYRTCESCRQQNSRCEERCYDTGYRCIAEGYSRGYREEVQGRIQTSRRAAERDALGVCKHYNLRECRIAYCDQVEELDRNSIRECRRRGSEPGVPIGHPGVKRVISWQHVKGKCYERPFAKISQYCGNRGKWQGISCVVNWSDGTTTELHGQVDLRDAAGNRYCTRETRPPSFNCVSSCDNANGALSFP